ncbi:MAG: hypothetical protein HKM89_05465 [Gemmatimonadales bacterium]|nr:hypothetical protein [Gemmatimonadales bacterium]
MRRSFAALVLAVLFAGCAGPETVAGPSATEIRQAGELRRCEDLNNDPSAIDDVAFEKACIREPALPQ